MHRKFNEKFAEMLGRDAPFIVATVIDVRGSAVAKPGAKAIIDEHGRPIFGWVGGGCVESFICAEAKAALAARAPRVITADLEEELSGVGLPCGGVMQIFIEPVVPPLRVSLIGSGRASVEASRMLERVGFAVTHYTAAYKVKEISKSSLAILAPAEGEDFSDFNGVLEAASDCWLLLDVVNEAQALEQLGRCGIREELLKSIALHAGLD